MSPRLRCTTGYASRPGVALRHFAVQLVERVADVRENVPALRREAIHPHTVRALGFGRAKPSTLGHAGEHRIQGAGAQPVTVMMQFLEHPVTVDAVLVGVMQDMNLPERKEKLADDRVAHSEGILACVS